MGCNVVPVRAGRNRRSHARDYLRIQTEIDRLLDFGRGHVTVVRESGDGFRRLLSRTQENHGTHDSGAQ